MKNLELSDSEVETLTQETCRYFPSGVRVNTVNPGYVPPMLNATNAGERADKIAMTRLRRGSRSRVLTDSVATANCTASLEQFHARLWPKTLQD